MDDPKLLATFPQPPPRAPHTATSPHLTNSPRPSDFGFIQVGLSREDDADSLYEDPPDPSQFKTAPTLAPLPLARYDSFQLILDSPSRTYSPSEPITGYIAGWNAAAYVHLVLEALAKTSLRDATGQHTSRAPLLYESIQLKPVSNSIVPRFCITVPERVAGGLERLHQYAPTDPVSGRYWTLDWLVQEPFESQAGHPLPPSMSLPFQKLQASGCGSISYKLIAIRSELDNATGKLIPNASCQVPLRLTTLRLLDSQVRALSSQVETSSSDLSAQTAQLSKDRPLTIREQLRDTFNTSAPALYFRASTSTPRIATPGASIKATVAVAIIAPPPGHRYNFPIPNITIARLTLRLRSFTGLRVSHPSPHEPEPPTAHTFKNIELDTHQTPSGAAFMPKNGCFDGQSCVSTITIPDTMLPSFKTYNIWRSYRIEYEVTFSVAGKEVSAKTKSDLNIVAPSSGDVSLEEKVRPETDREDDAASLRIAQGTVLTGLSLKSRDGA